MKAFLRLARRGGALLPLLLLFSLLGWSATSHSTDVKSLASNKVRSYLTINGGTFSLGSIGSHKASVFVFLSCQCPVSNLYGPRIEQLARLYANKSVQFIGVYPDIQESLADIRKNVQEHHFTFPVIQDKEGTLVVRLKAAYTPEAVVVDSEGHICYRGRIDDNVVTTKVTSHDLQQAIESVLCGRQVANPDLPAFGCIIRRGEVAAVVLKPGTPTYAHDVAPILDEHCVECHRPGQVAPFSLTSYKDAAAWAPDIVRYTQNGTMPPWKPAPGYGDFVGEHHYILTTAEKQVLVKWAQAGAPAGDLAKAPPLPNFPSGWKLGNPDIILQSNQPYHLAADGDDVYRNFIIDPHFTHDAWVRALEVHPDARAVVHHVIVYVDGLHLSPKVEEKWHQEHPDDKEPGYTSFGGPGFIPTGFLGGWAPGNDPQFAPPGVAMRIPKGALLVLQVHYHKNGVPQTDRTSFGLYLAKEPVHKNSVVSMVINTWFRIPAGASHYKVEAQTTIPLNAHILAIMPHMHLLGREVKLWASLPNGNKVPLIWIKNWDFNWQRTYWYREPIALPKGTVVHLVAYYDNSSDNPFNPNRLHPKPVGWGEQTTDEMCLAFLFGTIDAEHLNVNPQDPLAVASSKRSP